MTVVCTTMGASEPAARRARHAERTFGGLGEPGTRLLGGPRARSPEPHASHLGRLGPLALDQVDAEELRHEVARSGLTGRGGGQFPVAAKLEVAATSRGAPIVVVNASEGEPASHKDRMLLETRPHLVLDGALVAAHAAGAREIIVYLHRERHASAEALEAAIAERAAECGAIRVVDAPDRYVAGESSAVASYLEGAGALPRRRRLPVAASGVAGRPTVVSNAESVSNLALIARFGSAWFREAGDDVSPGSTLVTLAGDLAAPGRVVELLSAADLTELLSAAGFPTGPLAAVLVGGYSGTWLGARAALAAPISRGSLRSRGVSLGCGLIAVLSGESCGIRTTARLTRWLAGQSAGQCGPCVVGLPELASMLEDLACGDASRRDARRIPLVCASIAGRGDCGHPTGVATLVESALVAFADDVRRHASGRCCDRPASRFPIPATDGPPR